jgi:hypothetical protein
MGKGTYSRDPANDLKCKLWCFLNVSRRLEYLLVEPLGGYRVPEIIAIAVLPDLVLPYLSYMNLTQYRSIATRAAYIGICAANESVVMRIRCSLATARDLI